ncbi:MULTISPECIES: sulfite exporter TauE/SafE family protein [unclassified Xanthobacter]|uniref:sulfite exporter TauE/SafE family protein n=1 Tax=unclassified Xanthobacter TaxID=2623496 RepID=UPI001EE102A2
MLFQTVSAVLSGALSGFILGLIGGGGSVLATPLLLYVVGVGEPHIAFGTGALAVSVNAYANLIGHALKGHVMWRCAVVFTAVGTLGALIGSTIGKLTNGQVLLFLFGLVMALIAALMLRPRAVTSADMPVITRRLCVNAGVAALATGMASGLFGIGGGFLIVPALIFSTGMATIYAVGTSLLAVGTFGLATAVNYAASGLVDWRVAAEFLGGGLIGGVAGMALATRLGANKNTLNRIFAVVVASVAVYVLYRSGRALLGYGA